MRPGTRLSATRALAFLGISGFCGPSAAVDYDWCAPVVVRPDQRYEGGKECRPVWGADAIAAGADVVLLGSAFEVSEPKRDPVETSCFGERTHENVGAYVRDLRERALARGRKVAVAHMHRFDLVTADLAALDEFRASFLLETGRPWSAVQRFFSEDRSPVCAPQGCSWSTVAPGRIGGPGLAALIDAHGTPGRHERTVFYLVRSGKGRSEFWPTAALADLRDPAYRSWRVREAAVALRAGGYDAVMLNQKFHQYRASSAAPAGWGHWIGSSLAPDVTRLDALSDTLWSAPPTGYGYAEYLTGWAALADDLRSAGVPYAVSLQASAWSDRFDDPRTAERDESALIRRVATGARLALVSRPGPRGRSSLATAEAELRAAGVRVVVVDPRCGYGPSASGAGSAPPAREAPAAAQ